MAFENTWHRYYPRLAVHLQKGFHLSHEDAEDLAPETLLKIHGKRSEYPEIGTASEKIEILERAGYDLLGYLVLPPSNWIDNYYEPTERRLPAYLERHADQPAARELVELERQEAALYTRYQDWFSYGCYIARSR